MNKKIILSLSVIGIVAAIAIGGTVAYFSDTEKSEENTIVAGTIDIAVDNSNPWSGKFIINDLKPGETENKDFRVNNVGSNPLNLSKRLFNIVGDQGTSSEPECLKEGGNWDDSACSSSSEPYYNIEDHIYYDLSVEVYEGDDNLVWWQEIETGDRILTTVYSGDDTYVDLGMIPVDGYMMVHQGYHFDENAGNEYQGDILTFNMEFKAEQLVSQTSGYATVTLENKSGDPDWTILADNINGTLSYKTKGAKFDYTFSGKVKTNDNYTLIYVGGTNNYPCSGSVKLGEGSSSENFISFSGQVETDTITNGKIWLIPTSSYNEGSHVMTSWPEANILFETGLINYEKTS